MSVLDRSELQASPLADLHAIADQLGLEGFRRLRKAELIDAILGEPSGGASGDVELGSAAATTTEEGEEETPAAGEEAPAGDGPGRRMSSRGRRSRRGTARDADQRPARRRPAAGEGRSAGAERPAREEEPAGEDRSVEGVVELLGNGSAFLRVHPPEASDEDVYISAAQVRRCELVSGDRVSGPLRTPRRSERYPSLVRVQSINGAPAGEVSEGVRYEERPVSYPSERLVLGGADATLQAIEWLTPFGCGSRVVIVGPARAGKTEILRRLLDALCGREGLEVTLVLCGVRPEELAEWGEGPVTPAVALSFAASADAQSQAVEHAVEHRHAHRRARWGCARADRHARRSAPARCPQGPRGRAQPARRRVAHDPRDRHPAVRRGEHRDRAGPGARGRRRAASGSRRQRDSARRAARRRGGRGRDRQGPRERPGAGLAAVRDAAPGGLGRELDRLAAALGLHVDEAADLFVEGDPELALVDALVEPRPAEHEPAQPVHERALGRSDELGPAVVDVLAQRRRPDRGSRR